MRRAHIFSAGASTAFAIVAYAAGRPSLCALLAILAAFNLAASCTWDFDR